jgi:hypothetical protein
MTKDICPLCGSKALRLTQDAVISYLMVGGKLVPQLDLYDIGWLDTTELKCDECGANSSDHGELKSILDEYENKV